MAYKAYVTTLKNVRPHPNADRMKLADCFGNTICVGIDAAEGEIVIYFPTDGQLSVEYCEQNNLVRKKDENGNNIGGYLDPDKRNVKAIKLRGEKSDGIVMPLTSVLYTGINLDDLNVGDTIDVLNGHEICKKYIPRSNRRIGHPTEGNRTRKKKVDVAPLFMEHADTEQLAYNLGAFKPGDEIEITLKMHGTSQRTGYLPVFKGWKVKNKFFEGVVNKYASSNDLNPFVRKCIDIAMRGAKPIYDWGYVSGTRRTVLENYDGGFYGSNEFREQHSKTFEGKLWKGETVYYEVVGFTNTGAPIMADGNNEKLGKDFVKQYGKTTTFSYGCRPLGFDMNLSYLEGNIEEGIVKDYPQSDIYVYRMTMTNEDGDVVEYTPDFMRYRCEQMGVKTVPVFAQFIIPEFYQLPDDVGSPQAIDAGEYVRKIAEKYYDGPDPIGKTHIREGVVVRIINRPKFCAYKHKNFEFRVIEGIIKETAEAPDMEEAQEVTE